MHFKTMPRDILMKLLEEAQDTLSEPLKKSLDAIRAIDCPNCGGVVVPEPKIDAQGKVFRPGSNVPIFYAACSACGMAIDPETGIVIRNANR